MQKEEHYVNLEIIDQALMRSTNELERLASVYRNHGFETESEEILGTISRIRKHMNSEQSSPE